jgi:hypothetical protein
VPPLCLAEDDAGARLTGAAIGMKLVGMIWTRTIRPDGLTGPYPWHAQSGR